MNKIILIFLCLALQLAPYCSVLSSEIRVDMKVVRDLESTSQLHKARQALDELLAKNPESPDLLIESASLYLKMGQKMLALIEFEKARKLKPRDAVLFIELARLHLENFSPDMALSMAREAVLIDSSSEKGQEILILALMANTFYTEANARTKDLLRLYPRDPEVMHLAYLVNKENGRQIEAMSYLKQAIKAKPTERAWLLELADLYEQWRKYPEACQIIEDYLALEPDSVDGLRKLAWILEHSMHDYSQAQSVYSRLLKIDPLNAAAQAGLNRLEVKQNDFSAKLKRWLQSFWTQVLSLFAKNSRQERLY